MHSDEPSEREDPAAADVTPDDANGPTDERRAALRLPLLSGGQEIGLGDVIKRATTALGWTPCTGCLRRAQYLNQRVVLAPRRRGQ